MSNLTINTIAETLSAADETGAFNRYTAVAVNGFAAGLVLASEGKTYNDITDATDRNGVFFDLYRSTRETMIFSFGAALAMFDDIDEAVDWIMDSDSIEEFGKTLSGALRMLVFYEEDDEDEEF